MKKGIVVITIDEYRKEHNISKYKIIKNCGISATQLNSYCRNEITRIDLPVIARICDYLQCGIGDILRYVPNNNEDEDLSSDNIQ